MVRRSGDSANGIGVGDVWDVGRLGARGRFGREDAVCPESVVADGQLGARGKGERGKGEAYNSVSSLGLTILIRLKQQSESTMRALPFQYRESAS